MTAKKKANSTRGPADTAAERCTNFPGKKTKTERENVEGRSWDAGTRRCRIKKTGEARTRKNVRNVKRRRTGVLSAAAPTHSGDPRKGTQPAHSKSHLLRGHHHRDMPQIQTVHWAQASCAVPGLYSVHHWSPTRLWANRLLMKRKAPYPKTPRVPGNQGGCEVPTTPVSVTSSGRQSRTFPTGRGEGQGP